ncbi:MAG: stage III sporulation protein AC [Ruminococcaceae bacterium]|nr:stage III sporulation protein AC [Oscillospiraceae bacterium]
MDVGLILKIVGVGLLVGVSCQVLSKSGREDHCALVAVAGIITVLFLLLDQLGSLINTLRGLFGF